MSELEFWAEAAGRGFKIDSMEMFPWETPEVTDALTFLSKPADP